MGIAPGGPPWIMGVLNATPDSFSGDGLARNVDAIVARGHEQVRQGAAILDVGGESTRPGSTPVSEEEELARVLPVIERLRRELSVPISIDTSKARVAGAALEAGARIVNDVSGLRDGDLAAVAARHGAWLVVTHNGWVHPPADPAADIVGVVCEELLRLAGLAAAAGVDPDRVVVDPGLGFGKAAPASLRLLARTAQIRERVGRPLLVGPSRKSFIGDVLGVGVGDRLEGTLACVALAAYLGADLIRVHDVWQARRAMQTALRVALA